MAVTCPEERLDGSVARLVLGDDLERGERNLLGEAGAKSLRERRHVGVGRGAASRPLPHLAGAVRRLPAVGERAFEEREIHEWTVASRE